MSYKSSEMNYIEPQSIRIYNANLFEESGIITDYYQYNKLKFLDFEDIQYLYLNGFIYYVKQNTETYFLTNRYEIYKKSIKPINPIGIISIEKGIELF